MGSGFTGDDGRVVMAARGLRRRLVGCWVMGGGHGWWVVVEEERGVLGLDGYGGRLGEGKEEGSWAVVAWSRRGGCGVG